MTKKDWEELKGKLLHIRVTGVYDFGAYIEVEAEMLDTGEYTTFEIKVEEENKENG